MTYFDQLHKIALNLCLSIGWKRRTRGTCNFKHCTKQCNTLQKCAKIWNIWKHCLQEVARRWSEFKPRGFFPPLLPAIRDCCPLTVGSEKKKISTVGSKKREKRSTVGSKKREKRSTVGSKTKLLKNSRSKELTLADRNVWMTKTRGCKENCQWTSNIWNVNG